MPDDTSSAGARHVTVAQTPFAMVPEAVIYDHRLTDKAQRLYACLLRHGTDPENCYPSHKRLADLIGCSERSIARPMNELIEAGWIVRVKRPAREDGSRQTDGYFVHTTAQESATHNAGERGGPRAGTKATTQENVDPPRTTARTHHAQERGEREPLERKPLNETGTAALVPAPKATFLDFVDDPDHPHNINDRVQAIVAQANKHSAQRLTSKERRTLVGFLPDALRSGYTDAQLLFGIVNSPFRTETAVLGEARKAAKAQGQSVGDRGAAALSEWAAS